MNSKYYICCLLHNHYLNHSLKSRLCNAKNCHFSSKCKTCARLARNMTKIAHNQLLPHSRRGCCKNTGNGKFSELNFFTTKHRLKIASPVWGWATCAISPLVTARHFNFRMLRHVSWLFFSRWNSTWQSARILSSLPFGLLQMFASFYRFILLFRVSFSFKRCQSVSRSTLGRIPCLIPLKGRISFYFVDSLFH